jgi:hypothetical protein
LLRVLTNQPYSFREKGLQHCIEEGYIRTSERRQTLKLVTALSLLQTVQEAILPTRFIFLFSETKLRKVEGGYTHSLEDANDAECPCTEDEPGGGHLDGI